MLLTAIVSCSIVFLIALVMAYVIAPWLAKL
jgi:hypothetical protein